MKLCENRVLSLIGMSNVGKTFWSKKLAETGFKHINCDDLIETKLASELKTFGYSGIEDVANWMGMPHEERYAINQQKYLKFEKEIMQEIFARIDDCTEKNIVIDTTGGVVHTGNDVCQKLKACSLIVYLDSTTQMKEELFRKYIEQPKPVVFGEIYAPKQNETREQSLKRCYRELLDHRSELYAKYADVIITQEDLDVNMTANQFFHLIRQSL